MVYNPFTGGDGSIADDDSVSASEGLTDVGKEIVDTVKNVGSGGSSSDSGGSTTSTGSGGSSFDNPFTGGSSSGGSDVDYEDDDDDSSYSGTSSGSTSGGSGTSSGSSSGTSSSSSSPEIGIPEDLNGDGMIDDQFKTTIDELNPFTDSQGDISGNDNSGNGNVSPMKGLTDIGENIVDTVTDQATTAPSAGNTGTNFWKNISSGIDNTVDNAQDTADNIVPDKPLKGFKKTFQNLMPEKPFKGLNNLAKNAGKVFGSGLDALNPTDDIQETLKNAAIGAGILYILYKVVGGQK